ncbi:oxidoreductase [Ascochyta rabiei]|uniref:Oxidoreductase n=1 Tax=Didymella rabiei TaxID=5454 RepID=A0A163E8P1_DIDRA|nr:oxidoreductase [Ascochyta rabiei]
MAMPYSKTKDGFESQFGTNHLAHLLLFQLVKSVLLSSATPSYPSRLVSVSSVGHIFSRPNFGDYNYGRTAKSAEQGAATQVWAAVGREWKSKGGRHLSGVAEAVSSEEKAKEEGMFNMANDGYKE